MQKQQTKINHSYTLDSLEEKQAKSLVDTKAKGNSGRRDLRTLPFDFDTFKLVTQSFRTHGSISRVISRADVPFFSCESALMTERAYG